jgi:hypothetical protein
MMKPEEIAQILCEDISYCNGLIVEAGILDQYRIYNFPASALRTQAGELAVPISREAEAEKAKGKVSKAAPKAPGLKRPTKAGAVGKVDLRSLLGSKKADFQKLLSKRREATAKKGKRRTSFVDVYKLVVGPVADRTTLRRNIYIPWQVDEPIGYMEMKGRKYDEPKYEPTGVEEQELEAEIKKLGKPQTPEDRSRLAKLTKQLERIRSPQYKQQKEKVGGREGEAFVGTPVSTPMPSLKKIEPPEKGPYKSTLGTGWRELKGKSEAETRESLLTKKFAAGGDKSAAEFAQEDLDQLIEKGIVNVVITKPEPIAGEKPIKEPGRKLGRKKCKMCGKLVQDPATRERGEGSQEKGYYCPNCRDWWWDTVKTIVTTHWKLGYKGAESAKTIQQWPLEGREAHECYKREDVDEWIRLTREAGYQVKVRYSTTKILTKKERVEAGKDPEGGIDFASPKFWGGDWRRTVERPGSYYDW